MQLASRQCGFEHVACIHGPFCFACAHHGVQLINENNGLPFVFGKLVQYRFEALLKLSSEFGTGQQGGHVQGQDALAFQ